VLARDGPRLLRFERPRAVIEARTSAQVAGALQRADRALAGGSWVAGFVAYEAAEAFGLATCPLDPDGPPLVWLGVFEPPAPTTHSLAALAVPEVAAPIRVEEWRPGLDAAGHGAAVSRIHDRIAAGDTYQVNLTFPLSAPLREDPFALFGRLVSAQRAPYAAFVDLGRFAVASASPELFFRLEGDRLTTRPMKGTAPRGPSLAADERRERELRASEKDRAENLMIVDMLRNDLGRVAELGSVAVPSLFDIERYPTLLQMTSTVTARSRASFSEILGALFPCASVTGAPKKRTMEIIAANETGPRGVYTGAVGWAAPEGRACFNVAIRTAVADRERAVVTYGIGSGVVADSVAGEEYAECLLKARILGERPFALLETLAFVPGRGYRRLDGHLARLQASARHFGLPLDETRVFAALRDLASGLDVATRIRLLVDGDGRIETEAAPLPEPGPGPVRVGLAADPVDPQSVWLHHKTTRRESYDAAVAFRPDCDDVLLWNTRGEVTESSIANVVVDTPGGWVTPPLSSGLLAGVERAALLAEGRIREAVVPVADLRRGQRFWLVNSVRGLYDAELVSMDGPRPRETGFLDMIPARA
jgi:para-aminobenzoate synthetase/4-amino-4-deoxychorismate lyase